MKVEKAVRMYLSLSSGLHWVLIKTGNREPVLTQNQLHLKKSNTYKKKQTTELNGSFCIPTATKHHNCYKSITQQHNH